MRGRYEELRYITFANGRARREVMEEMEGTLDVENAWGPEWKEGEKVRWRERRRRGYR